MSETAFQAHRRKLRELKDKQEVVHPASRISAKAQKRRDAEAAAKPAPAKKKVSKKKTSASTSD